MGSNREKSVGACVECGEPVTKDWSNPWCPKCGVALPGFITGSLSLVTTMDHASAPRAAVSETPEHVHSSSPVVNRYKDAYRVGAALVGFGNAIKVIGAILAVIIFFGSMISGSSLGNGAVLVGLFLAAIVGVLFWVCGVLVAAQGEVLRATLDTAVASSHFLTDIERADAMGLPHSAIAPSAI